MKAPWWCHNFGLIAKISVFHWVMTVTRITSQSRIPCLVLRLSQNEDYPTKVRRKIETLNRNARNTAILDLYDLWNLWDLWNRNKKPLVKVGLKVTFHHAELPWRKSTDLRSASRWPERKDWSDLQVVPGGAKSRFNRLQMISKNIKEM